MIFGDPEWILKILKILKKKKGANTFLLARNMGARIFFKKIINEQVLFSGKSGFLIMKKPEYLIDPLAQ